MIPPLRGGDFQGIAGLSSDDSLLVGVNSARAKFYEGPRAVKHRLDEPGQIIDEPGQIIPQHGCVPALPASVSPGRGNFSGKATKVVRGSPEASVITHNCRSVRKRWGVTSLPTVGHDEETAAANTAGIPDRESQIPGHQPAPADSLRRADSRCLWSNTATEIVVW